MTVQEGILHVSINAGVLMASLSPDHPVHIHVVL